MRCAEARRSFIAAAQGVAIAKGAHLVGMLNAFEANGTAYAVMEREEGTDRAQRALSGRFLRDSCSRSQKACWGRRNGCRAGAIHGD
ncbi:MAG: hypothetical protein M3461_01495 [Pseudomonadota bacterium]|nr:hypothetical protein [Pseudomonadota bacterium]